MLSDRFDTILEELNYFDDWEDRYIYIIALGNKLPLFDSECRNDAYKIDGCVSQVWLKCFTEQRDDKTVLSFTGDSDAMIVKGLVAILFSLYDERTPLEILEIDAEQAFKRLGLEQHISPNRRNGFFSMVGKIRSYAEVHK